MLFRSLNQIYDGNIPSDLKSKIENVRKNLVIDSNTIGMKKQIAEKAMELGAYPVRTIG